MDIQQLSDREIDILRLVAQAKSNKQIALELNISVNTVKVHISNIFQKIKVSSRTEATLFAINNRLYDQPPQTVSEEPDSSVVLEDPDQTSVNTHENIPPKKYSPLKASIIIGILLVLTVGYFLIRQIQAKDNTSLLLDLQEDRWSQLPVFSPVRSNAAITAKNGKIYAIAGIEESDQFSNKLQVFDTTDTTWSTLANKPTAVSNARAIVIRDKIYVVGGVQNSGTDYYGLEVYDIRSDTWIVEKPIPYPLSDFAITTHNGWLLLVGGEELGKPSGRYLRYDPIGREWQESVSLNSPRSRPGAQVIGDQLVVFGGFSDKITLKSSEIISLVSRTADRWENWHDLPIALAISSTEYKYNTLFALGYDSNNNSVLCQFSESTNKWSISDEVVRTKLQQNFQMVEESGVLHFIGMVDDGDIPELIHLGYQAVYTIVLPLINK